MKYTNYIIVAGLLGSANLYATPFTDTGSIYNQLKSNSDRKIQKKEHPKYKATQEERILVHTSNVGVIKGFKVVGNDELTMQELKSVLDPYIGQELNKLDIHNAAAALTEYYQKKGFFTEETTLKPHSIKNGIVTLNVDERHLEKGGISVTNSEKRVKSEKVLNLWNNTMKPGAMKQDEYERAMLLTNDFPGISAKADLYFGEEEGTDDLVITVTDEEVFNGNIDIDNFGSYYTGRTQLGTTLYWNSPTKNGEEIVARFITTGEYSNYGYIGFALPVLSNGTRVGISFDYLYYELDHQKQNESGDGTAWNAKVYVKHPIVRSEDLTVEAELSYTYTAMKDNDATSELDNSKVNKGIFKLSGNKSDDLLLNGVTYFDVSMTFGDVKLENKVHAELDALIVNTAGTYTKLNFSLSRLQNLVGDLSSKISVDGQWASGNLDTSEKYFLGGPYSMPGYPVGQVAGDNAAILYADLRYDFYKMPWGGDFQLKAFYSHGWVELLKDPDAYTNYYSLDKKYNEMTLQTIGLGFSQTWTNSVVIRGMVGKQIGDNEYREIPENNKLDYDLSDNDYRAWVEAIYYF